MIMKINEKKFISNCLLQAIKYKLYNWKVCKIKFIFYRSKYMFHLHFYWQDDEYDYDFTPCKSWRCKPVFKGFIRKHKKGTLKRIEKYLKYKNKTLGN